MSRVTQVLVQHVPFVPSELEEGVLYVADEYGTATHGCCCGCGRRVVTPIKTGSWILTEHDGRPSLWPSIGNWSFPCKSHYWIREGKIEWSHQLRESEIASSRQRDQRDLEVAAQRANQAEHLPWWLRAWHWLRYR